MIYYQNKNTGNVGTQTDEYHAKAGLSGDCVELTKSEYEAVIDRKADHFTIGSTVRKVFATVSEDVFIRFVKRLKSEHLSIDEGLSLLVIAYADGYNLYPKKDKKPNNGADYLADHSKS